MCYPESVKTVSKKGKVEVRNLVDFGSFVRYEYLDPETGRRSENKTKLILRTSNGTEEFFIIPLKQKGRYLLIKSEVKDDREIWNGKCAVSLYDLLNLKDTSSQNCPPENQ